MSDDGYAISYEALARGTVVRSADGVELGRVHRVDWETRTNIFDGIVLDTPSGRFFLDAPEVAHIAERAVTTSFDAAEADRYLAPVRSPPVARAASSTVGPVRRWWRDLRGKS